MNDGELRTMALPLMLKAGDLPSGRANMKVHHFNCGTMAPPGAPIICHVLLVDTENGLVLVDSGFGLLDCADPRRIGPSRRVLRPRFQVEETAARQVEALTPRFTSLPQRRSGR